MCSLLTAYVFILGDDDGHFLMDKETGEIKLIRGFGERPPTPALHLQVMVRLMWSVLALGLEDNQSHHSVFLSPSRHIKMTTPGNFLLLQCWSEFWQ